MNEKADMLLRLPFFLAASKLASLPHAGIQPPDLIVYLGMYIRACTPYTLLLHIAQANTTPAARSQTG